MDNFSESDFPDLTSGEAQTVMNFVRAINGGTINAAINLLAADAQVNDQLRNFWGLDSISEWLTHEIIGERVNIKMINIRKHYDTVILAAELRGDFEVSGMSQPVIVDIYFTIQGSQIVRLQMLMVRESGEGADIRKIS